MAERKPTKKAVSRTAKPKAVKPAIPKVLSDKEIVLKEYPKAECKPLKNGLIVLSSKSAEKYPLHSGICKTESDAWKRAAQAVT